jgi:alpha-N-arabinofuranosidase
MMSSLGLSEVTTTHAIGESQSTARASRAAVSAQRCRSRGWPARAIAQERYTLTDALAIATYLHGFIRHWRVVRMANFAQLVNAIAPIFTDRQGLFLQTIYHPLRLYAEHTRPIALDVHVEGPQYVLPPERETDAGGGRVHHVSDLGPFSLIDAVASCDEGGREITVALVNRDRDRDLPATIQVAGAAVAGEVSGWEVNGPDAGATNSFEHPTRVGVARAPRHRPERRARLRVPGPLHHPPPPSRPLA